MAALLVVDDDPIVLSVTTSILERAGYVVVAAAGGAVGIAAFERHVPDIQVVLMDIEMPGVDGVAAFHQIRSRRRDVPFLFVTGTPWKLPVEVLAEPRVSILAKPYNLDDLVATVGHLVALTILRAPVDGHTLAPCPDPWSSEVARAQPPVTPGRR